MASCHSLTSRPSSMTVGDCRWTTQLSFFSTVPCLVTSPSAECSYSHSTLLCRPSIVFWVLGLMYKHKFLPKFYANRSTLLLAKRTKRERLIFCLLFDSVADVSIQQYYSHIIRSLAQNEGAGCWLCQQLKCIELKRNKRNWFQYVFSRAALLVANMEQYFGLDHCTFVVSSGYKAIPEWQGL